VRLIDVSAGGALFETQVQLRPDSNVVLHIVGNDLDRVVPSRVLRCYVSALDDRPWYRSACAFRRALDVPDLLVPSPRLMDPPPGDYVKTEFALKNIVDRYIELEKRGDRDWSRDRGRMLFDALQLLHESAKQRMDPFDRKLAELLAEVVPALHGRTSARVVMECLEEHLRRTLPLTTIGVAASPVPSSDGAEAIYFDVAASSRLPAAVLNVEFPAGFVPDALQFRLLKASAYVVTLLRAWHRDSGDPAAEALLASLGCAGTIEGVSRVQPAASSLQVSAPPSPSAAAAPRAPAPPHASAVPLPVTEPRATSPDPVRSDSLPPGWHRIVVRFVDGKLLRGYTNDFHASRSQLHLRQSPASHADPLLVPLAQLKAAFFVKDLSGDASHVDHGTFDHAAHGRKIEVTFIDGEVLLGSTLNYQSNGQGFFLTPADSTGNNIRAYVVSAAVRHARFLS
jgi:hypothetical protein